MAPSSPELRLRPKDPTDKTMGTDPAKICRASIVIAHAIVSLAWANGAAALSTPDARAKAALAISACRKVADPSHRLSCFDQAAEAFDQAQAQGQVVVVDQEGVQAMRRGAFGFNIPPIAIFKSSGRETPINSVSLVVAHASRGADGKWIMQTTDDAQWRQISDETISDDPHKGSRVAIRKAMLGSYFCKVDDQPAIRCVRDH